jgi:hypothetical protein
MAKAKSEEERQEEARHKAAEKQRKAEEKARAAQDAARRKQQEELLEPLRRALACGPMPLYASAKNPGLFAGKSKKTAEQALSEGFIELAASPDSSSGKRGAAAPNARLTDKGRRYVLEADSPKRILEELVRAVKEQGARPAESASNPAAALGREIAKLRESVNTQLAKIQQDFHTRLERLQQELQRQTGPASGDGSGGGSDRLHRALQTVEALAGRLEAAPTAPPVSTNDRGATGWSEEIVRLVREQKQRNAHQQLTLPQIYERLKSTRPGLTLGQFHDGLRSLQDQKRLRLWPYTQGVNNVPDRRNALYLDQELKFYVDLHEGA